jgi:hypothetical protein
MSDKTKQVCQEQAEEAYRMFILFCKRFSYYCIFLLVVLASCNFGVDGTGGKSNGDLHEEYKERMGLK